MESHLATLYDRFKQIRTLCTGILGYLSLLQAGDLKGEETKVLADLQRAANSLQTKLDSLRDEAAHVPHGTSPELDEAAAIIVAGEPRLRLAAQVLAKRLGAAVPTATTWNDELEHARAVIRELAAMNEALTAAHAAAAGQLS